MILLAARHGTAVLPVDKEGVRLHREERSGYVEPTRFAACFGAAQPQIDEEL